MKKISDWAKALLPLVGSGMVLHYLFLWHERRHAVALHKEVYHNPHHLRRDEKGAEDYHGCLYADYACRMDSSVKVSRNLIFYGHTFTDEDYTSGFEDLHKYRVFEFGQENPYIYVSLADEKLTYQIFSVWVCDANADTDCIQADPDDAAFQQILDKAVAGCAFDYGVDVMTDDHILTLSTCTADPNSRLLVVAKLIDGGGVDVAS